LATEEQVTQIQLELAQKLADLNKENIKDTKDLAKVQRELDIAAKKQASNLDEIEAKEQEINKRLEEREAVIAAVTEKQEALTEAQKKNAEASTALAKGFGLLLGSYHKMLAVVDKAYDLNMSQYNGFIDQEIAVRKYAATVQSFHVDLRRGTGFTRRYTEQFERLKDTAANLGITQDDLAKTQLSLHNEFTAFDSLSKGQRDNITKLSLVYQTLGVDAQTVGQTFDHLRFSMGLSGEAGQAAFANLNKTAKATGQSFDKVAKSFVELGPDLARFGSDGTRVFDALTQRARTLGLTTKDAFDIADSLDTFKGAAEITGRLNAQFGMQLNSVELMKASHEDRIELLRDEFQLSGRSFQSLHRRQKQMLASILGRDVSTVAKLFGDEMQIQAIGGEKGEKTNINDFIKVQDRYKAMAQQFSEIWLDSKGGLNKVIKSQLTELETIKDSMPTIQTAQRVTGIATAGMGLAATGYGAYKYGIPAAKNVWQMGKKGGAKGVANMVMQAVLSKAGTKVATDVVQKSAAPLATKAVEEAGEQVIKKTAAKSVGKMALKALPLIGLGIGMYDAAHRLAKGDTAGAMLEMGTGIAGTVIPGLGGIAAMGIGYGGLAMRDMEMAHNAAQGAPQPMDSTAARRMSDECCERPLEIVVKELVVKSELNLDGTPLKEFVRTYMNKKLAAQSP
jgi:hypothetical protein